MTEQKLLKLQASLPQIKSLQWDRTKKDLIETTAPVHSFIQDGVLKVSAEHGDGAADYYGEFRGGDMYINPALESWAKAKGGYWEWQNPGCICFYKI